MRRRGQCAGRDDVQAQSGDGCTYVLVESGLVLLLQLGHLLLEDVLVGLGGLSGSQCRGGHGWGGGLGSHFE
jgi:hypothetical protein